jgi:phage baseplate assembly protein W
MAEVVRQIRYPFWVNRLTGRAGEEPNYGDYIRQLIRQVLLTAKGERVCRPQFGAGIRRQVFAPLTNETAGLTRTLVYEALDRWLGRLIRVERIDVRSDMATLFISVEYLIIARGETHILNEEVVF